MEPKKIIIHHTASSRDNTTIQNIEDWHKVRWPKFISKLGYHIGYHAVITGDGDVTKTREFTEMGAHDRPNDGKIGLALTGNFETEKPSETQLNTLTLLLDKLKVKYNIEDKNIFNHRDTSSTLCGGKNLISWVNKYKQVGLLTLLIQKLLTLLKKYVR